LSEKRAKTHLYVHLQFEKFSEVYRHKYGRQCTDFCLKSAPKLTYVHLQFENFYRGTAPGPPAGGGTPLPLNPPTLKPLASPLFETILVNVYRFAEGDQNDTIGSFDIECYNNGII
jgi:hypothetical protein